MQAAALFDSHFAWPMTYSATSHSCLHVLRPSHNDKKRGLKWPLHFGMHSTWYVTGMCVLAPGVLGCDCADLTWLDGRSGSQSSRLLHYP